MSTPLSLFHISFLCTMNCHQKQHKIEKEIYFLSVSPYFLLCRSLLCLHSSPTLQYQEKRDISEQRGSQPTQRAKSDFSLESCQAAEQPFRFCYQLDVMVEVSGETGDVAGCRMMTTYRQRFPLIFLGYCFSKHYENLFWCIIRKTVAMSCYLEQYSLLMIGTCI